MSETCPPPSTSQAVLLLNKQSPIVADFEQGCVGVLLRPIPSVPWARVRSDRVAWAQNVPTDLMDDSRKFGGMVWEWKKATEKNEVKL